MLLPLINRILMKSKVPIIPLDKHHTHTCTRSVATSLKHTHTHSLTCTHNKPVGGRAKVGPAAAKVGPKARSLCGPFARLDNTLVSSTLAGGGPRDLAKRRLVGLPIIQESSEMERQRQRGATAGIPGSAAATARSALARITTNKLFTALFRRTLELGLQAC